MMFGARPYFMTDAFFRDTGGFDGVGLLTDYRERQRVEVEADDEHGAAEQVWRMFQNIDENWQTPDGGRSMMVGDIVMLHNPATGKFSLWQADMVGFKQVEGFRDTHH